MNLTEYKKSRGVRPTPPVPRAGERVARVESARERLEAALPDAVDYIIHVLHDTSAPRRERFEAALAICRKGGLPDKLHNIAEHIVTPKLVQLVQFAPPPGHDPDAPVPVVVQVAGRIAA